VERIIDKCLEKDRDLRTKVHWTSAPTRALKRDTDLAAPRRRAAWQPSPDRRHAAGR
jgi:hypothetical protein